MKNSQYLAICAAFIGSTFVFAAPEIVQSQADVVKQDPVKIVTVPASNEEAIAELLFQFQNLQMEISSMRGEIEQLNYQLDQLRLESKDRYIDLDRRISEGKSSGSGSSVSKTTSTSNASKDLSAAESKETADPKQIQADYNFAKDLIRQKDYVGAIQAFSLFVEKYPVNEFTANAYYWMGEVYLVIPDVQNAIKSFNVVVVDFSDHHKHPDALYRLGMTHIKNNDSEKGKKYLEQLLSLYPDSQLAGRAKKAIGS